MVIGKVDLLKLGNAFGAQVMAHFLDWEVSIVQWSKHIDPFVKF